MFFMVLGIKNLGSIFSSIFYKHIFCFDIKLIFQIFISLTLQSISLNKFLHVHKSSKFPNFDFQVPKSHDFHYFGHNNFGIKIFCNFFKILFCFDLTPKFHIFISIHMLFTSLKHFKILPAHKSSKFSNILFLVLKSHVFDGFGYKIFGFEFSTIYFKPLFLF